MLRKQGNLIENKGRLGKSEIRKFIKISMDSEVK
jgi:hypothetical protein